MQNLGQWEHEFNKIDIFHKGVKKTFFFVLFGGTCIYYYRTNNQKLIGFDVFCIYMTQCSSFDKMVFLSLSEKKMNLSILRTSNIPRADSVVSWTD